MKKGLDEAESKIASVSCGAAMKSRYLKELMTPMAMKLVKEADQDGGIPSLAVQKMMGRVARHERAWLMDSLHKIEDVEKQNCRSTSMSRSTGQRVEHGE